MPMKTIIAYSSITGNTKKVAEAIASAIPNATLLSITDKNLYKIISQKDYSLFFIGFYVDKGMPDPKVISLLKKQNEILKLDNENKAMNVITEKRIALFSTLGGDPQSDSAKKCMDYAKQLIGESYVIDPYLIIRGKISSALLQLMHENNPALLHNQKHIENIEKAKTHPDEKDLKDASLWSKTIYDKFSKINN